MKTLLVENGYLDPREVPGQGWCAVIKLIFTSAICCALDETGMRRRYCFEHLQEARAALAAWDGRGDPPGPWLKEKPSERRGPGAKSVIGGVA